MDRTELKRILSTSGCAEEHGGFVFMRDAAWGREERAEYERQTELARAITSTPEIGWLCIATGGTSGKLRFARHDESTLTAATEGFCRHFGFARVHAVGVLPLHHVSGLMAWVRSAATGGTYIRWDWKRLAAGDRPALPAGRDAVISLVPTQLQRLLGSAPAVDWLRRFRIIFIGGGPSWPDLLDAAAAAALPISLSYGMTETAAMIAALRPREFAAGDRSCGTVMPHGILDIIDPDTRRSLDLCNTAGLVRVSGASVFRGYFPDLSNEAVFTTEDLGLLDKGGRLTLIGRRDALIITGGKKVDPAEVERVLRATGVLDDVAVIGVPDPEWGQAVVACYPRLAKGEADLERVWKSLEDLTPYKRPKRILGLDTWPRNAQGKLNRAALAEAVRLASANPSQ
jgi:O-succinylbenzoic acid--CoA ligase